MKKSILYNYLLHGVMLILSLSLVGLAVYEKAWVMMGFMIVCSLFFVAFLVFVYLASKKVKHIDAWNKYFLEKNYEVLHLLCDTWHKRRPSLMSHAELGLLESMLALAQDDIEKVEEKIGLALKSKIGMYSIPATYYAILVAWDKGEEEKARLLSEKYLKMTNSILIRPNWNIQRESVKYFLEERDYPIKSEFFPVVDRLVAKKMEKNSGDKK